MAFYICQPPAGPITPENVLVYCLHIAGSKLINAERLGRLLQNNAIMNITLNAVMSNINKDHTPQPFQTSY
jgi:hypothetical protein